MTQAPQPHVDVMAQAQEKLRGDVRASALGRLLPIPSLALVIAGLFYYSANWYKDPFIVVIIALFAGTQILAQLQLGEVASRIKITHDVFGLVRAAGSVPVLEELRGRLAQFPARNYLRDVILHLLDLARKGDHEEGANVLNNAAKRRAHHDGKELRAHVTMNRLTLKLGFIGTLIGLLITFPPMKSAMLSLQNFNGEMAFVKDIVKAIEADQFAIYATLVATGLSFVMELLVIQLLTRLYGGFSVAESHLMDWNSTVLVPLVKGDRQAIRRDGRDLAQLRGEMDAELQGLHQTMSAGMQAFVTAAQNTRQQMEMLIHMQKTLGDGLAGLREYEWEKHLQHLADMEHNVAKRMQDIRNYRRMLDGQAAQGQAGAREARP